MDLALISAAFIAFALLMYLLLDGFDLGIGSLLLLESDEPTRDQMVRTIAPTWDGNETWLIMAAIALLANFPTAYGILVPAFYVAFIIMLLALGLRGIAFEFRTKSTHQRAFWDPVFSVGSILAAIMQGCVLGGLLQGVTIEHTQFAGGPLDVFSPFSLLCGVSLLLGYILLGTGWLHLKGVSLTNLRGHAFARFVPITFGIVAAAVCVTAVWLQPSAREVWSAHPLLLAALVIIFIAADYAMWRYMGSDHSLGTFAPFGLAIMMFVSAFAGLLIAIFPDIVPFRLDLWQAASPVNTQIFFLVGAAAVTPIVLANNAFSYWVFRNPTPNAGAP